MGDSVLVAEPMPGADARQGLGPRENSAQARVAAKSAALSEKPYSGSTVTAQNVIVFDWDDTIMPTSFLAVHGLHSENVDVPVPIPAPIQEELRRLDDLAVALLECAMTLGRTIIITNAESGWVEMSGARFLPRVSAFLTKKSVPVISARTNYEALSPTNPNDWKVNAFHHEIQMRFGFLAELNILSVGDGISERVAAHTLVGMMPSSLVKTVKFVERPNLCTLQRELHLMTSTLHDLFQHAASFDINLVS
ncbi:hypothetical protein FVE85_6081 [Porphyridium purpureum]|uniref:Uncharacterized protein n=1 Tax=Porphyridium purpureum TaxID=35688 RepID=A0A5J4Z4C4_PORPP|nr:hypothetical protein FVE85_6081 [Porphyridium purpureum]|eukprot:POR7724..scf295_1